MRRRLGAVALAGSLALAACGASAQTEAESVASTAPDDAMAASTSEIPDVAGPLAVGDGQIEFASLEGQDVVLWFWAPW